MRKKAVVFLLILTVLLPALLACEQTVDNRTPEERLNDILASIAPTDTVLVSGAVTVDGRMTESISGVLDGKKQESALLIGDTGYYFYNGMRLKQTAGGGEIVEYLSYRNALVKYTPFTVYSYAYDPDYVSSVQAEGNTVTVHFYNKGAQLSFGATLATVSGTFTLTLKDGKLHSSIFSSSYTEKKVTHTYTARYEYDDAERAFPSPPTITAADNLLYAQYFVKQASEKHQGMTLHTVGTNYNTKVALTAFLSDPSKIEKIFVTDLGTPTRSLTIVYKNNFTVIGLNNVQSMTFSYGRDYFVHTVYRNENQESYLLK